MTKPWLKSYPNNVSHNIDLNRFSCIMDVVDSSVKSFSDQPAFENMGHNISYHQLDVLSGRFASFLQHELKLQKGDRIAIQMPNLLQFPVVLFGALRAGLIIINTNPLYTSHEMEHQFKDSGAKCVVILANFACHLEPILKQTSVESVVITEVGDLMPFPKNMVLNLGAKYLKKMVPQYHLPHAYTFNQALQLGSMHPYYKVALDPHDIAFFQYTGGTTGVPKAAMLSHRNIVANMLQIEQWIKPRLEVGKETIVTALPLYHVFSLTVNCLAFMCLGAKNILVTNPKDISGFIKLLKTHDFSIMSGVNTLFNALMNHPNFTSIDFSKLKISVAGAMALQKPVAERWMKLTNSLLVEGYGLTEASPVVCCNPIDGTDRIGTIGIPLPDTDVRLVDEDWKDVPLGESGELAVKGPQVMTGYYKRSDESALVLREGWLKTGDVAEMLEGGFFRIVDRKKDMILVSGFNVYPNEVEEALMAHPGVAEVAAIGVADEKTGEAVKVFVVKKDPTLMEKDVIEQARKLLTNYKVPRHVEFRTELPKTNVGKILRRALRSA